MNLAKISAIIGLGLISIYTPVGSSIAADNTDEYEIRWGGTNGAPVRGYYYIKLTDRPNEPIRVEKVQGLLPQKVLLSLPKESIVWVYSETNQDSKIYVTIIKNGKSCGQTAYVGAGVGANKICR